ncbi:MAG: NAD-dependent epimerase/dehydratase family protein [Deltaproteobacteria bacterium]|nr:MAG: NAD-dependent epimerase/dehydratase family protein [Deltaproteobacteria bacterium]
MKALVTGGGGFLGRRIVELLIEQGHDVSFLARGHYPEVEALGARGFQIDLADRSALDEAVDGVDVIFHVAAKAGVWGDRESFYKINVDGTRNLLDAAEAAKVPRFVYTSTPSVVSYDSDIENGPQDLPYAKSYKAWYPASKAEAERMVLKANSRHLATVSLRPHLIFGPRDPHLLPRFVQAALAGRLRIIGNGENKVDFTYVDNAAWAHLDAADALTDHTAPCAGKAYFISNDEPVPLWGWFNELLGELDVPPVSKRIGHGLAKGLFTAVETAHKLLPLGEPTVTSFLADAMATSHWFDQEPAKRDFNYSIRVSMDEAMAPTAAYLKEHTVEPFGKGT